MIRASRRVYCMGASIVEFGLGVMVGALIIEREHIRRERALIAAIDAACARAAHPAGNTQAAGEADELAPAFTD